MFSEPAAVLPVATVHSTSPSSSSSSVSHSRTSTIVSNEFHEGNDSSSSQINLRSQSSQHQQSTSLTSVRQMKIGKYFLERTIGKGNFAVVKLATHCETHQKVAIKIIDKSRLDQADHKKLEREISVMKSLIHPFIIRLYEVMESKNLIYLVTEYAANGELLDLLIREKRLSEAKAKEKFRQLVLAVEYIHSKNIVHRDLKAENLLLDSRGNIKVADFGFANTFKPDSKLKTFCGSPPYAAPELYQCLPYSPEKVDVWSLGVLLYVFVCGNLPFDSNNLAELRKRVLAGHFRLPFYISSDCSSLIGHMLTVDPDQRYTIKEIKNHRWLMLTNSNVAEVNSTNPSISNPQLTNAILNRAESLGYNRNQIVKSVNGNSYDSDAAIWHLLLEQFQQTCQIDNSHIPNDPTLENKSNSEQVSNETIVFDSKQSPLMFRNENPTESPQTSPRRFALHLPIPNEIYPPPRLQIHPDPLETLNNGVVDDENTSDDQDDAASAQSFEQYARNHGLRRHTIARPDLLIHAGPMPTCDPHMRLGHQLSTIEPKLFNHRFVNPQQEFFQPAIIPLNQTDDGSESSPTYHPENSHSTSHNGLFVPSFATGMPSDLPNLPQIRDQNQYLSPTMVNNFHLNRRASDSGAHLLLFQQQYGVTGSNTFANIRPAHLQSPSSNRSSRGSITRGAPITTPTFASTPHEVEEDQNETDEANEDDDAATLARYLRQGKRHTVCEPGPLSSGKTRRAPGARESAKERALPSRRASDTNSIYINSSTRAHFERLYNNAVNLKSNDDEDLTASSLQELQKLQKQVQNYPTNNPIDSSMLRRAAAAPSPTNSVGLHRIQEEHQRNPSSYSNPSKSPSNSSVVLINGDDEPHAMDCDVQINAHAPYPTPDDLFRKPFCQAPPASFFYNTSSLLAQQLAIPTTSTTSSFLP